MTVVKGGAMKVKILCAALVLTAGIWWILGRGEERLPMVSYTRFLGEVGDGQVANAVVSGGARTTFQKTDGSRAATVLPPDYRDALAVMLEKGVNIEIQEGRSMAKNAAPFLVLLGCWVLGMLVLPRGRWLR